MRYWLNKIPLPLLCTYDRLKLIYNSLFKRIPIYKNNLDSEPFLIISAGRSGTTLLRIMLTKNEQISIPPESQFFHVAVRKFKSYNYLGWEELIKIVIGDLESKEIFKYWNINLAPVYRKLINLEKNQRSLAKIIDEIYLQFTLENNPNAILWGDKSPLHTYYISWIYKIFPTAKYIHLIRDGRASVNSMLNREYLNDTISKACKRWNQSVISVNKFKDKISKNKILEIKYENLVINPTKILKKVCSFINVEFHEAMVYPNKNVEKYGDTNLPHHRNLKNPVNTKSIDRWKSELSNKDKKKITSKLKKNLKLYGYIK
ncbi:MAG: sulfotransferase [Candidatus Cloacimonetes bacterium]|nr:sulfotransferase [Candidatus Cloacimonadota bacterium]MBS3768466.1 sulfotransferase [Candidatus Cloacimonadota bacterium]